MGGSARRQIFRYMRPLLLLFLRLFFERKYLEGRHFESGTAGLKWALRAAWSRNILRLGKAYPWPVALGVKISNPENLHFDTNDLNNFQSHGVYFQCYQGSIFLGKGSYIAPNVGIITANHSLVNLDQHAVAKDVRIGERCWIGMNSVILPGVELGPATIVAAGAVVTKSFKAGNVVLVGVPARILKGIGSEQFQQ